MKKKTKIIIVAIAAVLCLAVILSLVFYFVRRKQNENKDVFKEYYNSKIKQYEQENKQFDDYEVDVAFIGDSLTDGYDVKAAYPKYTVVNRGISGDTTFGVEKRLKVSLYDIKPKVVVMLIGVNNIDSMFENYEDILIGLRDNLPQTEVILISLTSMSLDWGKNNQLAIENNAKIKLLAEKYGFIFVDMYNPLLDPQTGELRGEYTVDGGHLTSAGYEVFTKTVTPILEGLDCLKDKTTP